MKKKGRLKEWLKANGKEVFGNALDVIGESTSIPVLSNLIEGIGESMMEDPNLSEEQKKEVAELIKYELELVKLGYADNADSRNMNVKIQESKESSWLAKNTAYILDLGIIFILGVLVIVLIYVDLTQQQKELALVGLGSFSALAIQIIHFHRGSSAGSKSKTNLLINNK